LCALVNINILRQLGCSLPIELWHFPDERIVRLAAKDFIKWGVTLRTIPWQTSRYTSKPYAILHSVFDELMVLDADNTPIRNPEYLFDSKEYNETGAIFWPDFNKADNPETWRQLGNCKQGDFWQQESGQILINRDIHKDAIAKMWEYNENYASIKHLLWVPGGDKDTYQLAWRFVNAPYTMVETFPGSCGKIIDGQYSSNTMVQHDLSGSPLFMHKNASKWHVLRKPIKCWETMIFPKDPSGKMIKVHVNGNIKPHTHTFYPVEEVITMDAHQIIENLEDTCLSLIKVIKSKLWYKITVFRFIIWDRIHEAVNKRKMDK
jgi:alpha 1,2-mannosyltransferase